MPIYDYQCNCGETKNDEFVQAWDTIILCSCGKKMTKKLSRFFADVFPNGGIFLEHVSPTGQLFHSKKEMRQYARDNDLELGAL